MTFHPNDLPTLEGKVYIVTGGSSGIGFHTVSRLAEHGAHVYLCARSRAKGESCISKIKQTQPSANIDLLHMDHTDLASVVAAATYICETETVLHGLVNNAGIMATPFEMTKDSYEIQWQTNYIAHWVFTEHLLPLLLRTSKGLPPGSVRIVNLTSSGHLVAAKGGIELDNTPLETASPFRRYGQSKLANILHTKNLHRKYGPGSLSAQDGDGEIWVSCIHPGLVYTGLGRGVENLPKWLELAATIGSKTGLAWDADKGSWNSVFLAASPLMSADQCGQYLDIYNRCGEPSMLSSAAKNLELAESLEQWTKEQMGKGGWVVAK